MICNKWDLSSLSIYKNPSGFPYIKVTNFPENAIGVRVGKTFKYHN
jgi:hypothetical protein